MSAELTLPVPTVPHPRRSQKSCVHKVLHKIRVNLNHKTQFQFEFGFKAPPSSALIPQSSRGPSVFYGLFSDFSGFHFWVPFPFISISSVANCGIPGAFSFYFHLLQDKLWNSWYFLFPFPQSQPMEFLATSPL